MYNRGIEICLDYGFTKLSAKRNNAEIEKIFEELEAKTALEVANA